MESERQDVLSEFEQLHQFLSEQQCLLLSQLEVIENEVLKRQNEYVTRVSEKKSLLAMLVTEVEKKCGQPATEFLQVRMRYMFPLPAQDRKGVPYLSFLPGTTELLIATLKCGVMPVCGMYVS